MNVVDFFLFFFLIPEEQIRFVKVCIQVRRLIATNIWIRSFLDKCQISILMLFVAQTFFIE